MAEDVQARPRTTTRARAEAPPGLQLAGEESRKAIGRYEVVKTIGKGAMGVVYKARDPLLDRVVAIKTIMSPQQQGRRVRSAFLERFQREAKAAAKMSHPAIVTIFDVGVDEDTGTPGYSPPEAIREGRYTPQADVFAWGAVMYELMSGRIPYEGPDTKTTNGYVVQGNAPPPTRHDPSIPEPLATVAMTALQPSDKTRFKDASEAEASLREAWDRCLTQGLVHPAILAMGEQSHRSEE